MTNRLRAWITKRRTFTAAIVLAYEPDLKRWWKLRLSVQRGVSGWTFKVRPPMRDRIKRLLYGWRFTNWLIAKPWPWRWHYRTIYRTHREGFPPDRPLTEAEANAKRFIDTSPKRVAAFYREPRGRLQSAWLAVTFPHVHGEWEE